MNKATLKYFTILLTVFFYNCVTAISQTVTPKDEIIFWQPGKRLGFADFGGEPGGDTIYAAGSKTHRLGAIVKGIEVQMRTEKGQTRFTIYAGMKKNKSWIRNAGDTISLMHEQAHFDICEWFARTLRRDIKKATSLAEARRMFDKTLDAEEIEQELFDKENNFESGGVTSAWKEKIRRRLLELEAHASPVLFVPITK